MSEARSAEIKRELVDELRKLIKGDVCSQFDPDYHREVRKVWNARLYKKKPLLYAYVQCQDDISGTLKFCKKHKLPLCIYNGGTSMFAQEDAAVIMKLEKMNNVIVHEESKIAGIECGAKQGDVDKASTECGLVTTLGQASFVGASGSGLLLGMGLLGRSYGFAIDNLHAIEMITGSGETVTASASENEELLYAMKGFGPNFGIITKLHAKLHPIPAQIMAGDLYFAWRNAANTLRNMRDFILEKKDERLAIYGIISTQRPRGKTTLFLRYVFNGNLSVGETYLEELCKRSSPDSWDVKPMPYKVFQTTVDDLHPFGNYYFDDKGGFPLAEMTNEVIDVLIDRYTALPSLEKMSGSACYILATGGAYGKVPDNSSPFLYRAAKFHITNVCSTPSEDFQNEAIAWLEDTMGGLSPFKMKVEGEIEEKVMRRLREVKRKYDPENFFKYNINISPD